MLDEWVFGSVSVVSMVFSSFYHAALLDCYNDESATFRLPGQTGDNQLECLGDWTPLMFANGQSDFNLPYASYMSGFGSVSAGEFWLGNQALYYITAQRVYNLRIDLWDSDGNYRYAEFKHVSVLDSIAGFQIEFEEFLGGTAGDGGLQSGATFYARDVDNLGGCGAELGGGWWYGDQPLEECRKTKLTGNATSLQPGLGIYWGTDDDWSANSTRSLIQVAMKLRPDVNASAGRSAQCYLHIQWVVSAQGNI